MKTCFFIFCFLVIQSHGWSQPGPEVFFFERHKALSDSLIQNPENDQLRLERIHLFYRDEDRFMTKGDIDYLFQKFEAGTHTIPLDHVTFYLLYGDCYKHSNIKLALSYYRKAADIRPCEYFYTDLFNGYYQLKNIDTALLYYDTLISRYGFKFQPFNQDFLTFYKIDLLNDHNSYNPKLTAFYNYLSHTYFTEFSKRRKSAKFELNYENQMLIESGFEYQFQLCDYYIRWQKYDLAEKTLSNLSGHIGKNMHSEPLQLYTSNKYYFLLGTILEHRGNPREAIRNFLYGVDYGHYKDTVWSANLRKNNPENAEALVLHAQTIYNQQKDEHWQQKDPNQRILDLFRQAKKMGSTNYRIFLAQADHYLFLKDYKKALKKADMAIKHSPHQAIAYQIKAAILHAAYDDAFISEKELEAQFKAIRTQTDPLYKNVVTTLPQINLNE